ncbi:Disease resistance protein RGA2 [Bienertia sinuspersici]
MFGIAQEVLKNLGSRALGEITLAWGFKDLVDKLKQTINTIKNVMLDAEQRQADSHAIRSWLERLAAAIYASDDLFDEVATIASQKQLMGGNKVTKMVHTFFSRSNQIVFAFSVSRKIKNIREKLDDIVKDNAEFNFVNQPHWEGSVMNTIKRRDKTFSYVDSNEVTGGDGDKKVILALLLASPTVDGVPDEHEALPVILVVGMGGMGKTTLA